MIAAEGEQNASKALREAADIMAGNSSALQLRYLQVERRAKSQTWAHVIFLMPSRHQERVVRWNNFQPLMLPPGTPSPIYPL